MIKRQLKYVVRQDATARVLAGPHGPHEALCLGSEAAPCAICEAEEAIMGLGAGGAAAIDCTGLPEVVAERERAEADIQTAQRKLRSLERLASRIVETKQKGATAALNSEQLDMIKKEASTLQDLVHHEARIHALRHFVESLSAWKPPCGLPLVGAAVVCVMCMISTRPPYSTFAA